VQPIPGRHLQVVELRHGIDLIQLGPDDRPQVFSCDLGMSAICMQISMSNISPAIRVWIQISDRRRALPGPSAVESCQSIRTSGSFGDRSNA
jgi:hypothetical protein